MGSLAKVTPPFTAKFLHFGGNCMHEEGSSRVDFARSRDRFFKFDFRGCSLGLSGAWGYASRKSEPKFWLRFTTRPAFAISIRPIAARKSFFDCQRASQINRRSTARSRHLNQ